MKDEEIQQFINDVREVEDKWKAQDKFLAILMIILGTLGLILIGVILWLE